MATAYSMAEVTEAADQLAKLSPEHHLLGELKNLEQVVALDDEIFQICCRLTIPAVAEEIRYLAHRRADEAWASEPEAEVEGLVRKALDGLPVNVWCKYGYIRIYARGGLRGDTSRGAPNGAAVF